MRSSPRARICAERSASGSAGELLRVYERFSVREPYSPDSVSAGRRALKNVCLDLLAASGQADGIARAFAQYQSADNMTDRLAGLSTLSLHDKPQRTSAFEDFYARLLRPIR